MDVLKKRELGGQAAMTMGRRNALALAGATVLACTGSPFRAVLPGAALRSNRPLVVLVAIDGVRAKDVFFGPDQALGGSRTFRSREQLVPHLTQMESSGVVLGAPGSGGFFASGPNYVSLPGYMEMLSGTSHVRCTENDCAEMQQRTLMDDVQENAPGDPTRSAVISSWAQVNVAAANKARGVVSAGRFDGENLEVLTRFPTCKRALMKGRAQYAGHTGFRSDRWTSELALSFFEEASPEFLFVSLGETDERAHEGNYAAYLQALHESDLFVGQIHQALQERRAEGHKTLLLVTTDHGRAKNFRDHGRQYPESAQSFLYAAGSLVAPRGWIKHETAYLRDIAPTIRAIRSRVGPRAQILQAQLGTADEGRVLRPLFA